MKRLSSLIFIVALAIFVNSIIQSQTKPDTVQVLNKVEVAQRIQALQQQIDIAVKELRSTPEYEHLIRLQQAQQVYQSMAGDTVLLKNGVLEKQKK